jgi:putative hydrolase of the HAD superfamily
MSFANNIKTIAFDADDTLWVNESIYRGVETRFVESLRDHLPEQAISSQLYETEMRNLPIFGYGAKSFMLSMIETAVELTNGSVSSQEIQQIIAMGKEMLTRPVQLLDEVEPVLARLQGVYTLMVLTKGDLLDQRSKIERSGLSHFFQHVEIVSDKKPETYRQIVARYGLQPEEFVMIGNSLRSDILPALEIGAYAIHIPHQITWAHEQVADAELANKHFLQLDNIGQVPGHF